MTTLNLRNNERNLPERAGLAGAYDYDLTRHSQGERLTQTNISGAFSTSQGRFNYRFITRGDVVFNDHLRKQIETLARDLPDSMGDYRNLGYISTMPEYRTAYLGEQGGEMGFLVLAKDGFPGGYMTLRQVSLARDNKESSSQVDLTHLIITKDH